MSTLGRLIILEGADCAGKSTLASKLASALDARVIHFGNSKGVKVSYPRFYADALLIAWTTGQNIIMDRSWLSEEPYGRAFRGGQLRFGTPECRMLEMIANAMGGIVIHCDPGWEHTARVFKDRQDTEYLDSVDQLNVVHTQYKITLKKCLCPVLTYDYTMDPNIQELAGEINLRNSVWRRRMDAGRSAEIVGSRLRLSNGLSHEASNNIHIPALEIIGDVRWDPEVLFVFDEPPELHDYNPYYSFPGVSFDPLSPEVILMEDLNQLLPKSAVQRISMMTVNAAQPSSMEPSERPTQGNSTYAQHAELCVAFGAKSYDWLKHEGVKESAIMVTPSLRASVTRPTIMDTLMKKLNTHFYAHAHSRG